jgi:hypothetical protein
LRAFFTSNLEHILGATNWRRLTEAALAGAGAAQQPHVARNPRENPSITVSIIGAVRLYQPPGFAEGMSHLGTVIGEGFFGHGSWCGSLLMARPRATLFWKVQFPSQLESMEAISANRIRQTPK